MLTDQDKKQIKNIIISFYKENKYFPFVEDLQKKYSIFFPQDLDKNIKNEINEIIFETILEELEKKQTKGSKILLKIFKNNEKLWKDFRLLNQEQFVVKSDFQKLGKEMEKKIEEGESKLVEKLVGSRSMGITKASDAWYDMVYAVFPEWNQIN